MDPNATVTRIIEAIQDRELDQAIEAIEDLQYWIMHNGFVPDNAIFGNLDFLFALHTGLSQLLNCYRGEF